MTAKETLFHITNQHTKGMPHEAGEYACWCIESVDVLQQEVTDLRAENERLRAALEQYAETSDRLGMTTRTRQGKAISATVNGVEYPRYGWSRCDRCQHVALLYYVTPKTPGQTWCKTCLKTWSP